MKKVLGVLVMVWSVGLGVSVQAQDPGFHLIGTTSRAVPVTGWKMTNLVFPVAVAAGVKVSRDVLAQKPKGVENVIELKAVRRNFFPTNLSVYGVDGRLYSFDLHYVEDTAVLNYRVVPDEAQPIPTSGFSEPGGTGVGAAAVGSSPILLSRLPVNGAVLDEDAVVLAGRQGFLHRSVRSEGMRLQLRGIYLRDSLLWLCLRVSNRTMIGFKPAFLRVFVEDRRQVKRTASQEVVIMPVYSDRLQTVLGDSTRSMVLGLEPMTLAREKKMVIELADAGGGRHMMLGVKGKVLLKARISKEVAK